MRPTLPRPTGPAVASAVGGSGGSVPATSASARRTVVPLRHATLLRWVLTASARRGLRKTLATATAALILLCESPVVPLGGCRTRRARPAGKVARYNYAILHVVAGVGGRGVCTSRQLFGTDGVGPSVVTSAALSFQLDITSRTTSPQPRARRSHHFFF